MLAVRSARVPSEHNIIITQVNEVELVLVSGTLDKRANPYVETRNAHIYCVKNVENHNGKKQQRMRTDKTNGAGYPKL